MARKTIAFQYKQISKIDRKKNQRRFFKYILKYKNALFLIFFSTILLIAQASLVPKLTQLLIDEWLPKNDELLSQEALRTIIGILIGLLALVIINSIATFISTFWVRKFQQNIEMDLKYALYKKILNLEISYFDQVNEGYFLSRMMRDTTMAAEYARYIPENILNIIVSFSMNFGFMFAFSWIISLAVLGFLVILFTVTFFLKKKMAFTWNEVRTISDSFNQFLVNSFAGVRETKAYTWETQEQMSYRKIANKYQDKWKQTFLLYGKWMTFNALILGFLTAIIWILGSWQVIVGNLTIGQLTALAMYGALIINPINKLLAVFDIFMRGSVALNRIFKLLDEKEELHEGQKINIKNGAIEFKNVYLNYGTTNHALKGVSFKIRPGEKVAFVGKTGSGKSTILKALVKFYNPSKGKILIDNQDIDKFSVKSLRKNITLMSQEPYIFFASLKKNIIFGNENVEEKQYEKVKLGAQINDFVFSLPEADQTNIGPRGVTLSGGQKQRVALARAFLKKSKIILFDEATSALDNKTEKKVKNQIKKLTNDSTVIYVAHRLTTIQDVDRIFVLDQGKIVESGSHQELLAKKQYYYDLVKSSNI